jgi:hypothetical protein
MDNGREIKLHGVNTLKRCKYCHAPLIEDAWEEVCFDEGTVIVDAFLAWVCSNRCGYYEKIENFE